MMGSEEKANLNKCSCRKLLLISVTSRVISSVVGGSYFCTAWFSSYKPSFTQMETNFSTFPDAGFFLGLVGLQGQSDHFPVLLYKMGSLQRGR